MSSKRVRTTSKAGAGAGAGSGAGSKPGTVIMLTRQGRGTDGLDAADECIMHTDELWGYLQRITGWLDLLNADGHDAEFGADADEDGVLNVDYRCDGKWVTAQDARDFHAWFLAEPSCYVRTYYCEGNEDLAVETGPKTFKREWMPIALGVTYMCTTTGPHTVADVTHMVGVDPYYG